MRLSLIIFVALLIGSISYIALCKYSRNMAMVEHIKASPVETVDLKSETSLTPSVNLSVREFNNTRMLITIDNNTDHHIYINYEPTMRHRPAEVIYSWEQLSNSGDAKSKGSEFYDSGPPPNQIPPQSSILFSALCPKGAKGRFRVVVSFFEVPNSIDKSADASEREDIISGFSSKRQKVKSEWISLPVAEDVVLNSTPNRKAINELPSRNGQEIIENEWDLLNYIKNDVGVGQIICFREHLSSAEGYCGPDEMVAKKWLRAAYTEYKGYKIRYELSVDRKHYSVIAVPASYGVTGVFSFYDDETGAPHGSDKQGAPATVQDPSVFDIYDRWR